MMKANQRKLVAGGLVFAMIALVFATVPMCATADTVILNPGYVNGHIGMTGVSINNGWVWALSTDRKYNASDMDVRTGEYGLTVEGDYTYDVYVAGRYTQKTTPPYKEAYYYLGKQTTDVDVGETVDDLNFLVNPGFIDASVHVTGGTITQIRWCVMSSMRPSLYLLNTTSVYEWGTGTHDSMTLPVLPCKTVDKNGDKDYLDTALGESYVYVFVDVWIGDDCFRPLKEYVDIVAGETVTVSWEIDVTPGWITGRMDIVDMGFNRVDILGSATIDEASLTLYRSLLGSATPKDYWDYTVNAVPGEWKVYPRFQFNDPTQNLYTWLGLQRMPKTITVQSNQYTTADFTVTPGYVTGTVNLNGAYAELSGLEVWGNYNREPGSPHAYTRSNTNEYQLILYPGAWQAGEPSLYVFFDNDPSYLDGNYDTSHFRYLDYVRYRNGPLLQVEAGETISDQDFTFGTGMLTLNYRISGGGILWAPEIRSTCTVRSPTNWNDVVSTLGYAQGSKTPTQLGSATITLPEGRHEIVASAMTETGGRSEFGHFFIDLKAGDIIEADLGSPMVTITSPTGLQHTIDSSIVVEGLVTDDTGVKKVTVNGVEVSLVDTNNPKDANEVSFSTTVTGLVDGENAITIVATDLTGKITTIERTVVKDVENTPPEAGIGGPYEGIEGTAVVFDASSSTDPQWDDLSYRWDFDNDGTYDTGFSADPTTSHSYPDEYTGTVCVEVSDGHYSDTATASVKIVNAAPVIGSYPDYTTEEDATIVSTFSFTDLGLGDTHTASISWGDGTTDTPTVTESSGSGSFVGTHMYTEDGDYSATITVTDIDGGTDTTELSIHVSDVLPYVSITADPTVINEGDSVSFSGSIQNLGEGDSYEWYFGDGSSSSGSLELSHEYTDQGEYTVSLSVTDDDGDVGTAETSITVNNVAPTATLSVPDFVDEGTEVDVTFIDQYDPGKDDTLTYSFDLDHDGIYEIVDQSSASTVHTWNREGSYLVDAMIKDNDGGCTEYEISVLVWNVAPEASITAGSETIDEGDTVEFAATVLDPGSGDTHTVVWDFGDGTSSTGSIVQPHTYLEDGSYEVTLTVTDDGGATDTATMTITVGNVAPTATLTNDGPKAEGDAVTVTFIDPQDPGNDPLTYSFDWDSDTTYDIEDQTEPFAIHIWNEPGEYTVTGMVKDDAGAYTEWITKVNVENVDPTATLTNNGPNDECSEITVLFTNQLDPGDGATFKYSFDWDNDNTYNINDQDTASASHTWNEPGTYTVKAMIKDDDGGSTEYTTHVVVNNLAPSIDSFTVSPVTPVEVGTDVSVSAEVSDPGGGSLTTTISWGDGSTTTTTDDTIETTHEYSTTGVYTIAIETTDGTDAVGMVYRYVVVYDPDGGFVTGGGWIDSPAGAYAADETLTGRANFGFVSKYKAGATEPTGNVEFQFKVGSLNFHSSDFDWLVVAGTKAMFKGTGTINGEGSYGFQISAIDGDSKGNADTFRIKIWDKDNGDAVVYDNQMDDADDADPTTELAGGQIVVHKSS